MTSPARLPSRMMRCNASRASVKFTESSFTRASQRRHAFPLSTTPAIGWLTSCAIEAASSPIVVTLVTWASSSCTFRKFASLRRNSSSASLLLRDVHHHSDILIHLTRLPNNGAPGSLNVGHDAIRQNDPELLIEGAPHARSRHQSSSRQKSDLLGESFWQSSQTSARLPPELRPNIRRCSADQTSFPVLIFQFQLPVRLIR